MRTISVHLRATFKGTDGDTRWERLSPLIPVWSILAWPGRMPYWTPPALMPGCTLPKLTAP